MPRIPESEIDRLKRETDLAALVRSRGVELERHGSKDLVGKCPFHDDNDKPNFIVSPEKGLFHCMACGAAGNAIQFVQRFDGVSFRHAYELLVETTAGGRRSEGRADSRPQLAAAPEADRDVSRRSRQAETDDALMLRVVEYYHERLKQTPAALDYLRGRGLYHEEAMERFQLGFADRTLGLRLPECFLKEGAQIRTRLQKLGLYRASGHEHFTGCLVLPVFADTGDTGPGNGRRVGQLYGRRIGEPSVPKNHPAVEPRAGPALPEASALEAPPEGARRRPNRHLFLPKAHEGIWNCEALEMGASTGSAQGEVILCEAPLDALTFWVNGFRNVTFIFGTEGFPAYLADALPAHGVKRVRLAYDADEAGNRAAEREAARFAAQGIECLRIKFPWGLDANEYARKMSPAAKALEVAIRAAEPMGGRSRRPEVRAQKAEKPEGETPVAHIGEHACSSSSLAASLAAGRSMAANEEEASALRPSAGSLAPCPPTLERLGDYRVLTLGSRQYRVGGLEKNNSLEVMKIALRLRQGDRFHLDTLDLLRDNERRRFIERAVEETGLEKDLLKSDLGQLLLALESFQEERLARAAEPAGAKTPAMTPEAEAAALAFLKSPTLVDRIVEAFPACGLAGEGKTLVGSYLACTSRLLDKPLAVIIQSTSAAGKSTLMDAVLSMFPEEQRVKYSAMTGQSLYYLGETDLQHKILAIVEEEGAEKASYALKLLQSEGELTIASTGKDPNTGRMVTHEYRVRGPVTIFLTTTSIEIDEELQNRCLMLTVDESREQTERIHALQRQARTLDGLRSKKRKSRLLALLRDAQRLLKPVEVMNPFAGELTFTAERTRTRRDHEKYLALMDAVALLHQYQRPRETDTHEGERTEFIRVTLDDIALVNRLAPELLGRSLDELPPQTRRVYQVIKAIVGERCRTQAVQQRFALFSRRELQKQLGWSLTQIRFHLERLRELEYIAARCGRLGSAFQYELLTDWREADGLAHIGLLDVEKLRAKHADTGVRRTTCRENEGGVGTCRVPPRQVQVVEEPEVKPNLSA